MTHPTEDDPIALICDEYSAHFSVEIADWCIENNIYLVLLPPNMTAKLSVIISARRLSSLILASSQVLDVGVHKSLRKALRRYLGRWLADLLDKWDKTQLWEILELSVAEAYTQQLILDAWAATCWDTLDPSPLVAELQARRERLQAAKQRSEEARARMSEYKERAERDGKQEAAVGVDPEAVLDEIDDLFPIPELPPPPPPRNTKYFPDGAVLNNPADYARLQRWEQERKRRKRRGRDGDDRKRGGRAAKRRREEEEESDADIEPELESDSDSDGEAAEEPAEADWDDVCGQCGGPVAESKETVMCSVCFTQLCDSCRGSSSAGTRSRPGAVACASCRDKKSLGSAARVRSRRG
jgi:hypothetical protein